MYHALERYHFTFGPFGSRNETQTVREAADGVHLIITGCRCLLRDHDRNHAMAARPSFRYVFPILASVFLHSLGLPMHIHIMLSARPPAAV